MASDQICVRTPSSCVLAAERLRSCCSALICACDNCANCSVFTQTRRKQRKIQSLETSLSFPLKLSVILVIAIFLSSRVNPCEIKVVFSSETSVLQTPTPGSPHRHNIKCPRMVEIVVFHCQRMAESCFPSNGCGRTLRHSRGNVRRRVLEHITRKLRSVL